MTRGRPEAMPCLPCALGVLLLVTLLALRYLPAYAAMMLGVIEHALAFWAPQFQVLDVAVTSRGGDTVVEAQLLARQYFIFYGQVVPDGWTISASTLAGHLLLHAAVLLTLLAGWPAATPSLRLARLVAALPMLLLLAWLDLPLVLVGSVHALMLQSLAPASLSTAAFVLAMQFLENGGRVVLVLLLAWAVIVATTSHRAQS